MKHMTSPVSLFFLFFSFCSFSQVITDSEITFDMDPQKSIIKDTESSTKYKTLLAAMIATDMEEILGYDGPFTVFAPSDTAFEKFSKNKIERLFDPENKRDLKALLTYHIIAGKLTASNILKAMCRGNGKATFTTVQGNEITAIMNGIDIVLTDDFGNMAKITTADADQCNGVIHGIDSVILPRKM